MIRGLKNEGEVAAHFGGPSRAVEVIIGITKSIYIYIRSTNQKTLLLKSEQSTRTGSYDLCKNKF